MPSSLGKLIVPRPRRNGVEDYLEVRILHNVQKLIPYNEDDRISGAARHWPGLYFIAPVLRRKIVQPQFLMQGVYAFSALHLAMMDIADRRGLAVLALNYQNQSLGVFQSQLDRMESNDFEAGITLSFLIGMSALGMPVLMARMAAPDDDDLSPPTDALQQITQILKLLRSTMAFIETGLQRTSSVNLSNAKLLRDRAMPEEPSSLADASVELLQQMLDRHVTNPMLHQTYSRSTTALRSTLRRSMAVPNAPYFAIMWTSTCNERFIAQLERRAPPALIIISHWAVALHRLSAHFWACNWGRWLVMTTAQTLQDQAWRSLLDWPMREMSIQPQEFGVAPLPWSQPVVSSVTPYPEAQTT